MGEVAVIGAYGIFSANAPYSYSFSTPSISVLPLHTYFTMKVLKNIIILLSSLNERSLSLSKGQRIPKKPRILGNLGFFQNPSLLYYPRPYNG